MANLTARSCFRWAALSALVFSIVYASHALAQEEDLAEGEEAARASFMRGRELFDAGNYEQALPAFSESVREFASPNAQVMVAETLRRLGRLDEAALAYEKVLLLATQHISAESYAQARATAQTELQKLWKRVARVQIDVAGTQRPRRVLLGEREIEPDQLNRAWPVMPGSVEVVAEFADREPWSRTIRTRAGAQTRVEIAASAARIEEGEQEAAHDAGQVDAAREEAGSGLETAGWVSLGAAGVGLATFATFYALALDEHGTYEAQCVAKPCTDEEYERLIEPGRSYNTVAHVGLATGVVGAAAALVLLLLDSGAAEESDPVVQAGRDSVSLRVRF